MLSVLSCQKDKELLECITVIFSNNLHPFIVFNEDFGSQLSSSFSDFLWDSSFLTWSISTIWWKKFNHCLLLSDCQLLPSRLFPFSVSRGGREASIYFFRVPLEAMSLKEPKWDSLLFLILDLVSKKTEEFSLLWKLLELCYKEFVSGITAVLEVGSPNDLTIEHSSASLFS